MPKLRLTNAAVERFCAPLIGQVEYYDTHLPAFGLRVSYSGTKAWFVMTRVDGKLTRITLGRYPAVSLADAREKARIVVVHAKAGADPRELKAEERRQRQKERQTTFENVAAMFMSNYVERELRPNTAREYRRILHGFDTQHWRSRPINSLTKLDIVELLSTIEERGAPAAANRGLAYLSKFLNWCLEQDLITANPAAGVRPLSAAHSRDRVLAEKELAWIWNALVEFSRPFGPLFQVLLLTGQRRGEVAGLRWEELRGLHTSSAFWDLPAARTKNGQPHLVPLAPAVQDIVLEQPRVSAFVFTTTSSTAVSGFSKAKTRLDSRLTNECTTDGLPMQSWTLHDLRRTMVTVMNERLNVQPHVVEAVVNHTSGMAKRGVAGVYNRALYLNDRRDALLAWADYIDAIARRTDPSAGFQEKRYG